MLFLLFLGEEIQFGFFISFEDDGDHLRIITDLFFGIGFSLFEGVKFFEGFG